ncbi:MAG: UDP-2,3-diacylglucosamine diphosphatase LpxI [Phycisphaerae bacterium]
MSNGISNSQKLVIVAGNGGLPFLVVRGAKKAGLEVCVLGIRDQASAELAQLADRFWWVPIARVGRWIKLTKKFGAGELILAGGVKKTDAFSGWRIWRYIPDLRAIRIWYRRAKQDRRNLAILSALADELQEEGITVVNSVKYCEQAMAEAGVMTRRNVSRQILEDIEFAWPIAQKIAELDVGQSLAVREKDIIAVEAIEGTDAMIERAGRLVRGNWTLIKVSQKHQDMRFDVPTVGPETIEKMHQYHGSALVVQAGKTIMIEKEKMIALADKYGIAVVGKFV